MKPSSFIFWIGLFLTLAGLLRGQIIFEDDFGNDVYSPPWTHKGNGFESWEETGGQLKVFSQLGEGPGTVWSMLSWTPDSGLTDFSATMDFGWGTDSEWIRRGLYLEVYGEPGTGGLIGKVGLEIDLTQDWKMRKIAQIHDDSFSLFTEVEDLGFLSSGTAQVSLKLVNGQMGAAWNGVDLLGPINNSRQAGEVILKFTEYKYNPANDPTNGFMSVLSADHVTVEAVPEPAAIGLLALLGLAVFLLSRKGHSGRP